MENIGEGEQQGSSLVLKEERLAFDTAAASRQGDWRICFGLFWRDARRGMLAFRVK